jgi:hypothetical protein
MKKAWIILGMAALLVFDSHSLWASEIRFTEPATEGIPVILFGDFLGWSGTPGPEVAEVDIFTPSFPFFTTTGLYGGMAYEPNSTTPSDLAFMDVSSFDTAKAWFFSDGFNVGPAVVAGYPISSLSDAVDLYQSLIGNYQFQPITETGGVDTIMSFTNNGNFLNVNIVSDAAPTVPIPGSVFLMGSGLLGLVGWRRFRKS